MAHFLKKQQYNTYFASNLCRTYIYPRQIKFCSIDSLHKLHYLLVIGLNHNSYERAVVD